MNKSERTGRTVFLRSPLVRWMSALLVLVGLASFGEAGEALSAEEKVARLAALPVSFYPQYAWVSSPLEPYFNAVSQPGDRLVIKNIDGLRDGFRSTEYAVPVHQVWLETLFPMAWDGQGPKNQAGIGGVFLYLGAGKSRTIPAPEVLDRDGRALRSGMGSAVRTARESLEAAGMELTLQFEYLPSRVRRNLKQVVPSANTYAIDAGHHVKSPEKFFKYVDRQIEWAKELNEAIQIEVIIAPGTTDEATVYLYRVLAERVGQIDRIGFRFTDEEAQIAGLRRLLRYLRPPAE